MFKFRTETAVIAEFETFEEAAEYSKQFAESGEGVAAVLPSGGMMNSKAFMFYARQRTRAIARVAARKAAEAAA